MAGSLHHLIGSPEESREERDAHGWSLIENMGDANECVEELLFLLLALTCDEDRERALRAYYQFARGEIKPEGDKIGDAYRQSIAVMRR